MILDINAVSDFADANQSLHDRLQEPNTDIHLRVIVLGEYRCGVKASRHRAARENWLDDLEASANVLAITADTSRIYADIAMSCAPPAGQKMIFGSPLWPGSTGYRFLATTRTSIT